MEKFVLAIDQGTTSSRAILFNKEGKIVYKTQEEVACLFPKEGWVEQNALDVWLSVLNVINDCLTKMNITYDNIDSIGITNQRETTIIWDKKTGMPVHNAIVWQSRQSVEICNSWEQYKELIHKKTGLILNPYFSASKIRFILDNIENGQQRAENGELLFGTIDTWLMYKMSKGKIFKTDVSNASRTMFFNINTLKYDDKLLEIFNIPKKMLPKVVESSGDFGEASFLHKGLKICGVAGDQQAALFGQRCFNEGEIKSTYGTGCFMLMNCGTKPVLSKKGLVSTVAWKINGETHYALEGSVFMAGASIQWLRDQLKVIDKASDSEKFATSVDDDLGVYVVPAFVGLGAPYWDNECKGAIFGLTRGASKEHVIRSVINSIAYQVRDIADVMCNESGVCGVALKVDGGATANSYLMQFQADILNVDIILPECLETSALGAAYLSGLGSGFWKDIDEIKALKKESKKFTPIMSKEERDRRYNKWLKAVEVARMFK